MNIQHNDFDNQLFTPDVSTSEVILTELTEEHKAAAWAAFEAEHRELNNETNFPNTFK